MDRPADGGTAGAGLALRQRRGRVQRDAAGDAEHRRRDLGAAGARTRGDVSVQGRGRSGRAGDLRRQLPDRHGAGPFRAGRYHPGGRAAGCRLPDGADHRTPARALAYRQHDAPRRRAGRDRARSGGAGASARPGCARGHAGRRGHAVIAARRGHALCARRCRHAARRRVRAVLLLRGGDQQADQRGAGPVRQDSRVQVLRNQDDGGRTGAGAVQLWRRADPGARFGLARPSHKERWCFASPAEHHPSFNSSWSR
ncbi:hypothetical protein CBM2599_B140042 [Cupriavidus taiwanensis]|nr:hypothetical protein CBM2599_B140042 [Cupriavidus taiwanensis]SOY99603.1 hypothetical protein CBM2600_B60320 [Cupriavidus taiwanensis]